MHVNTAAADEAVRDDSPAVPLVTVLVMATLEQRAAAPHAEATVNAHRNPKPPGIPRIRPPVMAAHTRFRGEHTGHRTGNRDPSGFRGSTR
jgi:hypothetical protein